MRGFRGPPPNLWGIAEDCHARGVRGLPKCLPFLSKYPSELPVGAATHGTRSGSNPKTERRACWARAGVTADSGVVLAQSNNRSEISQQPQTQSAVTQRNNSRASIRVPKKAVAASRAFCKEAKTLQGANEFLSRRTRERAHAATVTRWMPMNSRCVGSRCCTSRHSSMASWISSISSSNDAASVWQPGIWGTDATYMPSSSRSITTSN